MQYAMYRACCVLRVARCVLRTACCALRVARCVLRAACCALRVACGSCAVTLLWLGVDVYHYHLSSMPSKRTSASVQSSATICRTCTWCLPKTCTCWPHVTTTCRAYSVPMRRWVAACVCPRKGLLFHVWCCALCRSHAAGKQLGSSNVEGLHKYTRAVLNALYAPSLSDLESKKLQPFTLVGTCPSEWMWYRLPFFADIRCGCYVCALVRGV